MDPTIAVALVGLGGIFVTSVAGILVAIITNRREKGQAAETSLEKVLREKISLRDEQITDLKEELAEQKELNIVLTHELRRRDKEESDGQTEDHPGERGGVSRRTAP